MTPGAMYVGVVQDLEGAAGLGLEAVVDGRVAVLDRQGHRVVWPSQRVGGASAGRLPDQSLSHAASNGGGSEPDGRATDLPAGRRGDASCGRGRRWRRAGSFGSKLMPDLSNVVSTADLDDSGSARTRNLRTAIQTTVRPPSTSLAAGFEPLA